MSFLVEIFQSLLVFSQKGINLLEYVPGIKGEELLFVLENYEIYVGIGSACNSKNAEPSHVLKAMGIDLSNSSPIRISLGKYNTEEEIDKFVETLSKVVKMLRRRK